MRILSLSAQRSAWQNRNTASTRAAKASTSCWGVARGKASILVRSAQNIRKRLAKPLVSSRDAIRPSSSEGVTAPTMAI